MKEEFDLVQAYLPQWFQDIIDKNYYKKIEESLVFEKIIHDPKFLESPFDHIALYTDHGMVHVKNTTKLLLELIPKVNGILMPKRDADRLNFLKGCGSLLGYIHDIGMIKLIRGIHAEFVVHEVFSSRFDQIIDLIWQKNVAGVPWKILTLIREQGLSLEPKIFLREVLALAYCHSKSAVSMDEINDRVKLRNNMHYCLTHTLDEIFIQKEINKLKQHIAQKTMEKNSAQQLIHELKMAEAEYAKLQNKAELHHREQELSRYYKNHKKFSEEAYSWLTMTSKEMAEFTEDIVDTLRLLRCADALRQRGTDLKTSGGYQIFINQHTANAVYALKSVDGVLFLLEGDHALNASEANLASVTLTRDGDFIFSFYHGAFLTTDATQRAIQNLVILINDIKADVIDSFYRQENGKTYDKKNREIFILLETTEDNPSFTSALQ